MKIHFISLGCPRNLVDTETMLGKLVRDGHQITQAPEEAECVVVNTCGFIKPAVEESIETILESAEWKKEKTGRRLVVAGCLPERYRQDLAQSLPEVDVFLGTGAFSQIGEAVRGRLDSTTITLPPPGLLTSCYDSPVRFQTGPPHLAYLKIAEGCSAHCTYCIIPKLRGSQHSRPMEEILTEAELLAQSGVKECLLVAQNTTAYGHDLQEGYRLEDLLEGLASISGLSWIRLLYGHPDYITDPLIETIANYENICSYFDIPIQHMSPTVLRKMGRSYDSAAIRQVFYRIRSKIPDAALRTTVIVGFPGETDKDFNLLLDFMEDIRFDHLGTFIYSDDKDLPSHRLKDHVSEEVARHRHDQAMSLQAHLSKENNQKYLGKTLRVLIDEEQSEGTPAATGRSVFQAPEIDGQVNIYGQVHQGEFADVRILEVDEYDLTGETI